MVIGCGKTEKPFANVESRKTNAKTIGWLRKCGLIGPMEWGGVIGRLAGLETFRNG